MKIVDMYEILFTMHRTHTKLNGMKYVARVWYLCQIMHLISTKYIFIK